MWLLAIATGAAGCGGGSDLPPGAANYVGADCKHVTTTGLQAYYNCSGNIIDFRDKVAIPVAQTQGATVNPRFVTVFKKGAYTITVSKGQYAVKDGQEEPEVDSSKPGYAMMILTYKVGKSD